VVMTMGRGVVVIMTMYNGMAIAVATACSTHFLKV
jgi:hypothetical protein